METNDISIRPAKGQVTIGDGTTYAYGLQPFGLATLLKLTYLMKPFLIASMLSSHVLMLQVYES